jgi:hypothetical protein
VVLCDFEYSVVVDVEGSAPMRRGIGTAGFMAPEVIRGVAASVTTAADVYSAGASLRELLAHDMCVELQALVQCMCVDDPQQRSSAATALDAWERDVVPALLRLNDVSTKATVRHGDDGTAMNGRVGDTGDGVRAAVETTGEVPPPPAPSVVPSAHVWRQFGARDVESGRVLTDRNKRVVALAASGDVVLKAIFVDSDDSSGARHELRIHELLSRCASQFVVPLLAHFEAKLRLPGWSSARKNLVLVMPAGEVIDILSVREPRDMAQCGGELLAALAALHELRVLHNDVKWGNTLRVGASRRVVLCDFGLSVIVDVEGSAPMRRGVEMPGYMAPEVCVGLAASVTTAADVYSAGVALRGMYAFMMCAPLRALVRRMCDTEPQQRPSAAAARCVAARCGASNVAVCGGPKGYGMIRRRTC